MRTTTATTITGTNVSTNPTSNATKAKIKPTGNAERAAHAALASIPDASAFSGIGRSTLYKKAEAGELLFVKAGSKTLVDMSTLRA
jgi:hypothetical protein